MRTSTTMRAAMALGCAATLYAAFWFGKIGAPPAPAAPVSAPTPSSPAGNRSVATSPRPMSLPQLAKLCGSHPELTYRFYHAWGKQAPHAAMEVALALSGTLRAKAIEGVLAGWARTDAAAAWRWLAEKRLANELPAELDPTAAANAIATEQIGYAQDEVLHRTYRWNRLESQLLVSTPPWGEGASKIDAAAFGADSARFQRLALLVQGGARSDGLTVVDWIAAQNFDSEAKGKLLDVAAKNWLREPLGSDQVLAWVQQSSGPEMDRAKSTIAATVSPNARTLEILRSITDTDIRTAAVFRAATVTLPQMDADRMDWLRSAARTLPASVSSSAIDFAFAQWFAREPNSARSYLHALQTRDPEAAASLTTSLARLGG